MRIGINAGHTVSGQPGCGAVGYIDESVETRKVGQALMRLFLAGGHTVIDCTNDYAPSTSSNLKQIVDMANAHPLDLFVSIHFNAGGGKGSEVYTYDGERHTEAVNVCSRLNSLGFADRGIKNGSGLAVVRKSQAKAMLIEVCFVDTQSDVELYNKIGFERIAQEIYIAITGETIKESEDLTMTQYEELKSMIAAQGAEITALKSENEKLKKSIGGTFVYDYIDDNMPTWAHEAVKWCVDKGIITGTGKDKNGTMTLGLNHMQLWVCVVMYRVCKAVKG